MINDGSLDLKLSSNIVLSITYEDIIKVCNLNKP